VGEGLGGEGEIRLPNLVVKPHQRAVRSQATMLEIKGQGVVIFMDDHVIGIEWYVCIQIVIMREVLPVGGLAIDHHRTFPIKR
jgi:hypothetical protein